MLITTWVSLLPALNLDRARKKKLNDEFIMLPQFKQKTALNFFSLHVYIFLVKILVLDISRFIC